MDILEGLNPAQREAVTSTEGCVRVIAGAGSGKTRALVHRFAYLVNEIGVMPADILCVTFTNKSANEMRRRIRQLTGDSDTGLICTFHSMCANILSEEANAVGYPLSFIVLDNADIDAMLEVVYEERGLTMRDRSYSDARDMIEIRKTMTHPDYYMDLIALPLDVLRRKYAEATSADDIIFYGYLFQEKKCFGLDYNDLIYFTLHIFRTRDDIREKWQDRFEYIMIDEFQDIDPQQYELMQAVFGRHGNLFIVGDPDQTIYTWRGASVRFILDFDKAFPNVKTVIMNENYRSTPEIVAAANSLISANKMRIEKELVPIRSGGKKPVWFHGRTGEDEARYIADCVKALGADGAKMSDIAVIYRSHFVSRAVEEVFIQEKIPYQIYSGAQFFERAEIKDALSYLRFIAFGDDLSFARIINRPKRNIGRRRMEMLTNYVQKNGGSLFDALCDMVEDGEFKGTDAKAFIHMAELSSEKASELRVSDLLSYVMELSGYEAALRTAGDGVRLDNLAELKQSIYEFERDCGEEVTLGSYLRHVSLFTNADAAVEKNAVKLMTVHTAKGLEFRHLFVCTMAEGVFPSKKTSTPAEMEEERRLAFVALTRAQDTLCITDSEGRNIDGSYRFPSRFVLNIRHGLLDTVNEPPEELVSDAAASIEASQRRMEIISGESPFKAGDRVVHSIMGAGTVVDIDTKKAAYRIKFDALPTERRISFKVELKKEQER